ncbi:hypothetical protein PPROV_000461800 [Pycnococcus provasolii]|uniref:Uncharacterized protein n=1 Tax=Pycnococcus provasolii TaxID=41880 RepID=A0A830HJW7_9CHLO|nr:hypothetical protein PPROV_000461800 [Pycnococcus provasolii]
MLRDVTTSASGSPPRVEESEETVKNDDVTQHGPSPSSQKSQKSPVSVLPSADDASKENGDDAGDACEQPLQCTSSQTTRLQKSKSMVSALVSPRDLLDDGADDATMLARELASAGLHAIEEATRMLKNNNFSAPTTSTREPLTGSDIVPPDVAIAIWNAERMALLRTSSKKHVRDGKMLKRSNTSSTVASAARILAAAAERLNDGSDEKRNGGGGAAGTPVKRKRSSSSSSLEKLGYNNSNAATMRFTRKTSRPYRILDDDAAEDCDNKVDPASMQKKKTTTTTTTRLPSLEEHNEEEGFCFLGETRSLRAHVVTEVTVAREAERVVFESATRAWMKSRSSSRNNR